VPVRRLAGPDVVAVDRARVAAVIDRIAADVDELARARRVRDLDAAAVARVATEAAQARRLLTCGNQDYPDASMLHRVE
jgi:hypothetical protein